MQLSSIYCYDKSYLYLLIAIREDRTRGGRSTYQCSYTLPAGLGAPASLPSVSLPTQPLPPTLKEEEPVAPPLSRTSGLAADGVPEESQQNPSLPTPSPEPAGKKLQTVPLLMKVSFGILRGQSRIEK